MVCDSEVLEFGENIYIIHVHIALYKHSIEQKKNLRA